MKHMLNTDFHVAISPLLPCDISIEFQSNVFSHSLAYSYSNIAYTLFNEKEHVGRILRVSIRHL